MASSRGVRPRFYLSAGRSCSPCRSASFKNPMPRRPGQVLGAFPPICTLSGSLDLSGASSSEYVTRCVSCFSTCCERDLFRQAERAAPPTIRRLRSPGFVAQTRRFTLPAGRRFLVAGIPVVGRPLLDEHHGRWCGQCQVVRIWLVTANGSAPRSSSSTAAPWRVLARSSSDGPIRSFQS